MGLHSNRNNPIMGKSYYAASKLTEKTEKDEKDHLRTYDKRKQNMDLQPKTYINNTLKNTMYNIISDASPYPKEGAVSAVLNTTHGQSTEYGHSIMYGT